jgi:hypothetical protein
LGAAFAVVAFFGAAFAAVLVAVALAVVAFALGRVVVGSGPVVGAGLGRCLRGGLGSGGLAQRGSGLAGAVWAPLALPALPAAMRAFAAFCAAALPVVLTTRPPPGHAPRRARR